MISRFVCVNGTAKEKFVEPVRFHIFKSVMSHLVSCTAQKLCLCGEHRGVSGPSRPDVPNLGVSLDNVRGFCSPSCCGCKVDLTAIIRGIHRLAGTTCAATTSGTCEFFKVTHPKQDTTTNL